VALGKLSALLSGSLIEDKAEKEFMMKQSIVHVALVVKDYDEAIAFYTQKLHFTLLEDTYQPLQDKRWVVVAPPGSVGTTLLLAKASKPEQEQFVGNQTGGRVFLFLNTDNFRGGTTQRWLPKGSGLSGRPKKKYTGLSRYLKISTAIYGICCS
jgi:catechol 2,3-dioxygenase-like lactoylglutathione lyase family enzyme